MKRRLHTGYEKRYIISYIERVPFLIGDGVCGVLLLGFIGWERSLSIFLLRLSRNSIGSGGQVSVCEQVSASLYDESASGVVF
jgi:hypothetical protein